MVGKAISARNWKYIGLSRNECIHFKIRFILSIYLKFPDVGFWQPVTTDFLPEQVWST